MPWRGVGYCGTVCNLVHSQGRGTVRYSGYARKVHCAHWYGTIGTLVRYSVGEMARCSRHAGAVRWYGAGVHCTQQAYQNLESFHNQFSNFHNQFCTFDNQFCTFHNEFLDILKWYGGEVRWVRCTVPLHHTVPLCRTVPDTVPHRTYRTSVPYSIPHPTVRTTNLP